MASSSSPMAVAHEQRQQQVASAAPRGDVIMPTIREYIQHQHQVVRHQRRHAERAADRDHRAVTSPPSSSGSRMDAVSSTPDDDVAVLPPLIAMLRHPAFSHSAAAAATAGRVPPLHPLTPFQSYAGAPPLPGRWRSIQFQKLDKSVLCCCQLPHALTTIAPTAGTHAAVVGPFVAVCRERGASNQHHAPSS